jgi:aryl-alcohol dehydrogenase-like predicted oxidoreductase
LAGFDWLKERWMKEDFLEKVRKLNDLAASLHITLAQLSIAWCIRNPHVTTTILGATSKEQLLQNLGSLDALTKLDTGIIQQIEDIVQTKPVLPEH